MLLLDKPRGLGSNAALQAARRLMGALKAGHTGTLDPLASGLLPIAFGEATKLAGLTSGADKRYTARILLGVATDSGDAEGRIIARCPVGVDAAAIEAALARLRGEILQLPPMHSALKRDGRPLYELARRGIEVERPARRCRIDELRLTGREGDFLDLAISCSKGTYIRSLAIDIGTSLGCGAHVTALRRTAVGQFDVSQAIGLDALEALTPFGRMQRLLAPEALAAGLARIDLEGRDAARFLHGQAVEGEFPASGEPLRVHMDGRFRGLGRVRPDGRLQPLRLLGCAGADEGCGIRLSRTPQGGYNARLPKARESADGDSDG
ncbi:MAG: tRNA pseudouridine(55) synthase TruB [Rhodocyclaceae bacterium]